MLSRFICSLFGHKIISVVTGDTVLEYRCVRCESWLDVTRTF